MAYYIQETDTHLFTYCQTRNKTLYLVNVFDYLLRKKVNDNDLAQLIDEIKDKSAKANLELPLDKSKGFLFHRQLPRLS
jgi:hypothetical protein